MLSQIIARQSQRVLHPRTCRGLRSLVTRQQSEFNVDNYPLLFSRKKHSPSRVQHQIDRGVFRRTNDNGSSQKQQENGSVKRFIGYTTAMSVTVMLLLVVTEFSDDTKSGFLRRVYKIALSSSFVSDTTASLLSNPHSEIPAVADLKQRIYPVLNLDEANQKLKASELSYTFTETGGSGDSSVSRFDILRLPSNSPCEDDFSFGSVDVGRERDWQFWGVYDGHAGWATSSLLRHSLIAYVGREVKSLISMQGGKASPEEIDATITSAFLKLDEEIMDDALKALTESRTPGEAVSRTAPARAGSCALLAVHDPTTSLLRVACVGDSRAVLGRRQSTGGDGSDWIAIALSSDQTGFNEDECARLAEKHPGEPNIIDPKSGRLMGIAVTRAFGDHRWKWPSAAVKRWSTQFFGSDLRPHYQTPPYMTAEPVITTTKVQQGDFVILASDGFWDRVTNEDAVKCVSMWIDCETSPNEKIKPSSSSSSSSSSIIQKSEEVGYPIGRVPPDTFVVEDENVATHLVRNALGGNRRDLFCGELSLQSPDSRYERDDITVQVIFFGDVTKSYKAHL